MGDYSEILSAPTAYSPSPSPTSSSPQDLTDHLPHRTFRTFSNLSNLSNLSSLSNLSTLSYGSFREDSQYQAVSSPSSLNSQLSSPPPPKDSPWNHLFKASFGAVVEWVKGQGPSPHLVALLDEGRRVCAVCPTTEDDKGYWLVCVMRAIQDQNNEYILELVKLTSTGAIQEGRAGSEYFCSEGDLRSPFWELESRLLPIPVSQVFKDGEEFFRLDKNLEEVLGLSSDNASIMSDESTRSTLSRRASVISRLVELYHLNEETTKFEMETLDLDSTVDVMQKCRELVSNLAQAVIPSYFNENPLNGASNFLSPPVWLPIETLNGIELFSKSIPGSNFSCFMAKTVIDASPMEVKYLIKQSKNREQYDPMCRNIEVIETVDENTSIVYFVDTKYFFNRDFCIIRHNFSNQSDGSVYLVSNSVKTPRCPKQGYTRATVIESGFIIEPRGRGESTMSYVVQVDLNVWAPKSLLDHVIKSQVHEVLAKIRDYFTSKNACNLGRRPSQA